MLNRPSPLYQTDAQPTATANIRRLGPIERIELTLRHTYAPITARACVFRIGDTLIDAGFRHATDALVAALADRPPARIILTHHHEDHFAALAAIASAYGAPEVLAPAPLVEHIRAGIDPPPYRQMFWGAAPGWADVRPYDIGSDFSVGNITLRSIPTPGHTPYHAAFVLRHAGIVYAISGDLWIEPEPTTLFYEASLPDSAASARTLAAAAGDEELVLLPSHGAVRQQGSTLLRAYAAYCEAQIERIIRRSEALATRDYWTLAVDLYGPPNDYERLNRGELNRALMVRAALDPVRMLPASTLPVPEGW